MTWAWRIGVSGNPSPVVASELEAYLARQTPAPRRRVKVLTGVRGHLVTYTPRLDVVLSALLASDAKRQELETLLHLMATRLASCHEHIYFLSYNEETKPDAIPVISHKVDVKAALEMSLRGTDLQVEIDIGPTVFLFRGVEVWHAADGIGPVARDISVVSNSLRAASGIVRVSLGSEGLWAKSLPEPLTTPVRLLSTA